MSASQRAMLPNWLKVDTIMNGTQAMRDAGEAYLPRFSTETETDYVLRQKHAPFTNIFSDILSSVSSRPFEKEVVVTEESAGPEIEAFVEDVDGAGNHLTVFAAEAFEAGIAAGIDWWLVDKGQVPEGATQADVNRLGIRPYWVRIPAKSVLAVHSDVIGGKEIITHFRFMERINTTEGYDETTVDRIRVFEREAIKDDDDLVVDYAAPTFRVLTKVVESKGKAKNASWEEIESGDFGIGEIPIVPFLTGKRKGMLWEIRGPMFDAADLQIKHFQIESGLQYATDMTCFPMLSGLGINPPLDAKGNPEQAPVGPKRVLYAPMNTQTGTYGEWKFIEPATTSLQFIAERLKVVEADLRELGRQPLTAGSNNITVIAAAFASKKANSAAQQWAMNLKDSLENAFKFTAMWLGVSDEPKVVVFTDFDVASESTKDSLDALAKARENNEISRKAYVAELKRRGTLMADYDEEADMDEILKEIPADDGVDEEFSSPPELPEIPEQD